MGIATEQKGGAMERTASEQNKLTIAQMQVDALRGQVIGLQQALDTAQARVKELEGQVITLANQANEAEKQRNRAIATTESVRAQLRQVGEAIPAALLFINKMPAVLHADHSFDWVQGYQSALYDVQRILISDPDAMKRVATLAQDAGTVVERRGQMHSCDIPGCLSCANPEEPDQTEGGDGE